MKVIRQFTLISALSLCLASAAAAAPNKAEPHAHDRRAKVEEHSLHAQHGVHKTERAARDRAQLHPVKRTSQRNVGRMKSYATHGEPVRARAHTK